MPFGLLIVLASLNGIAFMQARAMTHFVDGTTRTVQPEALSLLDKVQVILTGVQVPRPENQRSPQNFDLAYETHTIPIPESTETNDSKPPGQSKEFLEAWFIPASTTPEPDPKGIVLLFPPYAGSKDVLLDAAALLNSLGYATLIVDFRGVGGSSGSDTTLGVREAVDVEIVANYAQENWPQQPLILYGASMGAAAVMRAIAQDTVTPQAIILESPFDRLLHTVQHRFEAMGLPPSPGAELLLFWGSLLQDIDGFDHNPVDYAPTIHQPTLLMYGTLDQRVTKAEIQSIFAALPGEKQFFSLATIGHGSLATHDPEAWTKQVSQFLSTAIESQ